MFTKGIGFKDKVEEQIKSSLIEEIKKRKEIGASLVKKDIRDEQPFLYSCALKYYSSWENALSIAGLASQEATGYKRESIHWDGDVVIEKINERLANMQSLKTIDIQREFPSLYTAARIHYGSWKNAIEATGLDYSTITGKNRKVTKWSKKLVLEIIRERFENGRTLHRDYVLCDYGSLPGYARKYFGSWKAAIEAAGVDVSYIKERLMPADVIIILGEMFLDGEFLDETSIKKHDYHLYTACIKHFGSVENAIASVDINNLKGD